MKLPHRWTYNAWPRNLTRVLPDGWPKRLLPFLGYALVGFALAWLIVALAVFPDDGAPETTIVPSVLGLRYEEAERALREKGLTVALGERRVSGSAPNSTVLSQSPAPGSQASPGVTVTLDVSAGQRRSTVPPVAGLSREGALTALRGASLDMGKLIERAGPEPRGTVLGSQPDAGRVVPERTAIDLVVSSGPAELTMPDIVGRGLSEARATIEQLGLVIGEITYDSAGSSRPGRIVAQLPNAGSLVPPGGVVTLRVSGMP